MLVLNGPQNLAATQAGHRDIGEYRIVTLKVQIGQCLLGAICRMTFMTLSEQVVKCRANVVIVIDDQQYGHLLLSPGNGFWQTELPGGQACTEMDSAGVTML